MEQSSRKSIRQSLQVGFIVALTIATNSVVAVPIQKTSQAEVSYIL